MSAEAEDTELLAGGLASHDGRGRLDELGIHALVTVSKTRAPAVARR